MARVGTVIKGTSQGRVLRFTFAAAAAAFMCLQAGAETLNLPSGAPHTVTFAQPVATFYIEKPEVLDARSGDNKHVTVIGLTPGTTAVAAYDTQGHRLYSAEVRVGRGQPPRRRSTATGNGNGAVILQLGRMRHIYSCSEEHCNAAEAAAPPPAAETPAP